MRWKRDRTEEWLLPGMAPRVAGGSEATGWAPKPSLADIERRLDEAVVAARVAEARSSAAEAGVMSIGASAFDAAEQAARAAQAATDASAAALRAQRQAAESESAVEQVAIRVDLALARVAREQPSPGPGAERTPAPPPDSAPEPARPPAPGEDPLLRRFTERADHVAASLSALDALPVVAGAAPRGNGESPR